MVSPKSARIPGDGRLPVEGSVPPLDKLICANVGADVLVDPAMAQRR